MSEILGTGIAFPLGVDERGRPTTRSTSSRRSG
jgi:hypothetical protein